ncbi:conserved protein of unknown function [Paraburkholderia kururiensis]
MLAGGDAKTPPARFGFVDLRLYVGGDMVGVARTQSFRDQLFLLLAGAVQRGLDDGALLRFGIAGGRGRRCAGHFALHRCRGCRAARGLRCGVQSRTLCHRARFRGFALALHARKALVMAFAGGVGLLLGPGGPARCAVRHGHHRDAIDRAGRHTQIAARAQRRDDRMHLFRCPDDCIDRACLHAQRAADTQVFVDHGERTRPFGAVDGIERDDRLAEQAGKARHAFGAAGRALVVVRGAGGDGFGVGPAAVVAALGALRLGEQIFDAICECLRIGHGHDMRSWPKRSQNGCKSAAERPVCAVLRGLSEGAQSPGRPCSRALAKCGIIADFPDCHWRPMCHNQNALQERPQERRGAPAKALQFTAADAWRGDVRQRPG